MSVMSDDFTTIPGSERPSAPDTGAPVDPGTTVEVTIVLRRRAEPAPADFAAAPLSREELAQRYGADPAELEAVTAAVTAGGAEVVSARRDDPARAGAGDGRGPGADVRHRAA